MVIIRIDRKIMKTVFTVLLAVSVVLNIFFYVQNKKLESRYEAFFCISNQFDSASTVDFVVSSRVPGNKYKDVEIFDISKGEVIKKVKPNDSIQSEAVGFLKNITGMYVKIKAFPEKGYIIRVPFEPFIALENHWLNSYGINSIGECFILFPEKGKPFLLVLNSSYRPYFYNFEGNTDKLLNFLDFHIRTPQ